MVRFVDDSGLNPLPPATRVLVYPIGKAQTSGNLVASAYIELDGSAKLDLQPNTQYAIAFLGTQGPKVGVAMTTSQAGDTVISIPSYHTPEGWLSGAGNVAAQAEQWPYGWFGSPDDGQMPMERWIAAAFGGVFGTDAPKPGQNNSLGRNLSLVLLSMRLDTAIGNDLDLFAQDFLGDGLPRLAGESDDAYREIIRAALIPYTLTLDSIQQTCNQWAKSWALRFGKPIPDVLCADTYSDPARCATVGVTDNEILIQITFYASASTGAVLDKSFVLDKAALGDLSAYTISSTAPDPRLEYLIRRKRSAAKKPIYATHQLFKRV